MEGFGPYSSLGWRGRLSEGKKHQGAERKHAGQNHRADPQVYPPNLSTHLALADYLRHGSSHSFDCLRHESFTPSLLSLKPRAKIARERSL